MNKKIFYSAFLIVLFSFFPQYGMEEQALQQLIKISHFSKEMARFIEQKQYEILLYLLKKPDDVDVVALALSNTLKEAIYCSDNSQKKFLHQKILNIALIFSAERNLLANAVNLMKQGAEVNCTVSFKTRTLNALTAAIQQNNFEMTKLLLENNANPAILIDSVIKTDIRNAKNSSHLVVQKVPCSLLSFVDDPRIMKLLLKHLDPKVRSYFINLYFKPTEFGTTDLVYGSGRDGIAVVSEQKCPHFGLTFFRGKYPLHHILLSFLNDGRNSAENTAENIELLIDHGASLKVQDADGNNVFHILALKPTLSGKLLNLLINSKNKDMGGLIKEAILQKNSRGETPLHIALKYGKKNDLNFIISLFKLGASIEERTLAGWNVIDLAISNNFLISLMEENLISQEDILKKDASGRTRLYNFLTSQNQASSVTYTNAFNIRKVANAYQDMGMLINELDNSGKRASDFLNKDLKKILYKNSSQKKSPSKNKRKKNKNVKNKHLKKDLIKAEDETEKKEEEISTDIHAKARSVSSPSNLSSIVRSKFGILNERIGFEILCYHPRIARMIEESTLLNLYRRFSFAIDIYAKLNKITQQSTNKNFHSTDTHYLLPAFLKVPGKNREQIVFDICANDKNVIYHRGFKIYNKDNYPQNTNAMLRAYINTLDNFSSVKRSTPTTQYYSYFVKEFGQQETEAFDKYIALQEFPSYSGYTVYQLRNNNKTITFATK